MTATSDERAKALDMIRKGFGTDDILVALSMDVESFANRSWIAGLRYEAERPIPSARTAIARTVNADPRGFGSFDRGD